jgi:hypothetical protein
VDVKELSDRLSEIDVDDDLEVAIRINGRMFSVADVNVIEVKGTPFILALDCEAREEEEEDEDVEEDERGRGED